MRLSIRGRP